MIYLNYDGTLKYNNGVSPSKDFDKNQRTLDPLSIRQFLGFLSQFESGVKVVYENGNYTIEVLEHAVQTS